MDELIAGVRKYAMEHYEDGGWDVIVEATGDDELREMIGRARTLSTALANVWIIVSIWAERQADARNSAF